MNKREVQKEQRRIAILNKSLELFIKKGYHGTTIRDVATAVGMSPGLMFHYFDTKEALYTELLRQAAAGAAYAKSFDFETMQPIEMIEAITSGMFLAFESSPESLKYFLLAKQALYADYLTPEMEEIVSSLSAIEAFVPLIQFGQQAGQIKKGDPLALSMAFFSAIQGTAETLACFPNMPLPDSAWLVDILRENKENR